MTEIPYMEVLEGLLGAREDLGSVARSVLFSVVVLVIEGRRLDARGGFYLDGTPKPVQSDVSIGLYTIVVTY